MKYSECIDEAHIASAKHKKDVEETRRNSIDQCWSDPIGVMDPHPRPAKGELHPKPQSPWRTLVLLIAVFFFATAYGIRIPSPKAATVDTVVEQSYSLDGSLLDVELVSTLKDGPIDCNRYDHAGHCLLLAFDHANRKEKLWTDTLDKVLVTDLAKPPKLHHKSNFKRDPRDKGIHKISGVQCYALQDVSDDGYKYVEWINVNSRLDDVASMTFFKGKLIHSRVRIERRLARAEDRYKFAFPKHAPEIRTSNEHLISLFAPYIIIPIDDPD